MIKIESGASPTSVLELLQRAVNDLSNVRGEFHLKAALNAYLLWTYRTTESLSPHIHGGDLERLVNTRRYWLLQEIINPQPDTMIRHLIDLEIDQRLRELEDEISLLKTTIYQWKTDFQNPIALILDTCVLLEHHQELNSYPWNEKLNIVSDIPIILTIPVVVIDELDRLKQSNAKSNGKEQSIRTKARLALKMMDQTFEHSNGRRLIQQEMILGAAGHQSAIHLAVLIDEIGHTPLEHVDSEIVDRALTLSPYVREVRIATYDTGMALRARQSRLKVCKLEY